MANAKIAFLLRHPFHYFLYRNVYRLINGAEFILDTTEILHAPYRGDLSRQFTKFLENEGVVFHVFSPKDNADNTFKAFEVLVSNVYTNTLRFSCNQKRKKARIMYGYGKDLWNFGTWSRNFDIVLTLGEYANRMLKDFVECVTVGVPQFDPWFIQSPQIKQQEAIASVVDPKKKTIVYLPTHGDLSSLFHVAKILPELSKNYNLILKPHSLTLAWEPWLLLPYRNHHCVAVLDDFTDIAEVLSYGDVILSDNSGAIFEALLVDKPLVILDFWDSEYFRNEHRKIDSSNSFHAHQHVPLSWSNSLEQQIKKNPAIAIGETVSKITKLPHTIARAYENKDHYEPARSKLRDVLYSFRDGTASQRAAEALGLLPGRPQKQIPLAIEIENRVKAATKDLQAEVEYLRLVVPKNIGYY